MRLTMVLAACVLAACTAPDDADDDGGAGVVITDEPVAVDSDLPPIIYDGSLPHLEAFFAVPKADGTPDAALENKIIELIDGTPKGARIRISMFLWSRTKVSTHLADASDRGVDVKIVIDKEVNQVKTSSAAPSPTDPLGGIPQPPATPPPPAADQTDGSGTVDDDMLDEDVDAALTGDTDPDETLDASAMQSGMNAAITILENRLPKGSITYCTRGRGSCIGKNIDHNKIYMFSQTGTAHHVVVQSSANLTTHMLHNNLVISSGDNALYTAYVHYFDHLDAKQESLDFYRSETGDHTIAYYFPRATGDTIVSVLDKVRCKNGKSHVRVAMAFFTRSRRKIAEGLAKLAGDKCDVRVNMRHAGQGVDAEILKILRDGGVDVATYPTDHGTNIHSKYLIIDSPFVTNGTATPRELVWTGSHNYNGDALRDNDEAILRVDNKNVFDAFMANWNTMRAQM